MKPAKQLLYIEDDEIDVIYMTRLTKSLKNEFTLHIASSFDEAQRKIAELKIDLILTDNNVSGHFLADSYQNFKSKPFILTSGLRESDLAPLAKKIGAAGFLEKPIQLNQLVSLLESLRVFENSLKTSDTEKTQYNKDDLLAFSCGDTDFSIQMIELLSNRFHPELSVMKEGLLEGDLPKIGRIAHNLKSSFLIFRQEELGKLCERVELLGLNSDKKSEIEEALSELELKGKQFINYLNLVVIELKSSKN